MRCSCCGAVNADNADICIECDEPVAASAGGHRGAGAWFAAYPVWLRWIIALPVVAVVGAIIVRRLDYAGLSNSSSGIVFAAAIAVTMFCTAYVAALAAPSYRKHVGLAVVFSELAVFCTSAIAVFNGPSSSFPTQESDAFFIVVLTGATVTIVSLAARKSLANKAFLTAMPGSNVGLQRGLGIAVALGASAAFAAVGIGVSELWRLYFPPIAANTLTALIGTGITVTLVIHYEPVRKKVAAWIVGGFFVTLSAVSIVRLASVLPRMELADKLWTMLIWSAIVLWSATMVGALLGLHAAWSSINAERREN